MNQIRLTPNGILWFRVARGAMIVCMLTATTAVAAAVTNLWTQEAKLFPVGPNLNKQFGNTVAIDDDWIVVGAARDSSPNYWGGSVQFFPRTSNGVGEPIRFIASEGRSNHQFGSAVDIDGSWAVVGAVLAGNKPNNSGGGGVYFFKHTDDAWNEISRVNASDYDQSGSFGGAVAIDGDLCIVGAHWSVHSGYTQVGSAYILQRSGDSWNEVARLQANDPANNEHYGFSVAIDGDRALVGAVFDSHAGAPESGAAYLYEQSGGTWSQVAKLTADDAQEFDYFGSSVALDGDRALIGAKQANAGYVFELAEGRWQQTAKLTATNANTANNFGVSVALEGNRALIGAQFDDDRTGAAYVFESSGDAWSQMAKLAANDARQEDLFGCSVDLSGNWAVAGARLDDHSGQSRTGSAYAFAVPEPSTIVLLGMGAVGLAAYGWRRTRNVGSAAQLRRGRG